MLLSSTNFFGRNSQTYLHLCNALWVFRVELQPRTWVVSLCSSFSSPLLGVCFARGFHHRHHHHMDFLLFCGLIFIPCSLFFSTNSSQESVWIASTRPSIIVKIHKGSSPKSTEICLNFLSKVHYYYFMSSCCPLSPNSICLPHLVSLLMMVQVRVSTLLPSVKIRVQGK